MTPHLAIVEPGASGELLAETVDHTGGVARRDTSARLPDGITRSQSHPLAAGRDTDAQAGRNGRYRVRGLGRGVAGRAARHGSQTGCVVRRSGGTCRRRQREQVVRTV